jgi:SAM-dependent methyltransferase
MRAAQFEQRYRIEGDPWRYRSSEYERGKYDATLSACGTGPFRSALELGGSIGVFSARLAPRCQALTTIDFAPSAVEAARGELAPYPHARALLGDIPGAIPDDRYDLIVASEILYYLDAGALSATVARLEQTLERGGRLVMVHWRPPGPERPYSAASVHDTVGALSWLELVDDRSTTDYLLHAMERR